MEIEKSLKRSEVFLGLGDEELRQIAALPSCRQENYQGETVIFKAGDEARNLYLLEVGQVNLVMEASRQHSQAPKHIVIDRITTGDFFGWSALVGPHFYVMSAICRKPSRMVVISGTELMTMFERDYHIGYRIFQSLSRIIGTRLRYMEQALLKGHR